MNQNLKRATIAAVCVALGIGGLSACTSDSPSSGSKKEAESRDDTYNRLVANQPAHTGDYSPTRETKNFWIDTWMKKPGKLSYVYVQNANGKYGYYILKGLPVSYCVSLVPTQKGSRVNLGSDGSGAVVLQQPSVDGTYSSASNCNVMYGKDAETGAYLEWSVGMNQSYFLYDQPMDLPQYKDATPLGEAKIKN